MKVLILCMALVFSGCSSRLSDSLNHAAVTVPVLMQEDYKTEQEMVAEKEAFLTRLFSGDIFGRKDVMIPIVPVSEDIVSVPAEISADSIAQQRAEVYGQIICSAADPQFWQSYFDGGQVSDGVTLTDLQARRDALFLTYGYDSEFAALTDLELSREDPNFRRFVRGVIDSTCASAFAATETRTEDLFADSFVE